MPAAAAVVGSAAIGGAVSYFGGKSAADSAKKASKAQQQAAAEAAKLQREMYAQTRTDLAPYRDAGTPAVKSILGMYGLDGSGAFDEADLAAFRSSPDYQVAMREGVDALNNRYAAKGELKSGRAMKGIMDYASDLGDKKLADYMARLFGIAGMGQNSAAGTASASMATGRGLSDLALGAGDARASGIVGSGNAWNAALSNLGETAITALNRNPSAYATPSLY
jgi:hypothetical protein